MTTGQWWNEVVLTKSEGTLTRLDLIRIMRDREGGAHLDQTIPSPAYKAALLDGAGFTYSPTADQSARPVEYAIEAIIRQICTEAVSSLKSKAFAGISEMQQLSAQGSTALFVEVPPA